jgi:AcrR family transcriptional regulator
MSSANTFRAESSSVRSSGDDAERPRERIVAVARDLFYRHGIRAVGVDAIAEAAATNKMTLYRHFASKDLLVAECLRRWSAETDAAWDENAKAHAGDPREQLLAWLRYIAEFKLNMAERGCAFINAVAELPEKDHPARRVVEEHKSQNREKIIALCREAGLSDPDLLADSLFLLCEGARVSVQSVGREGPAKRLVDMLQGLIASHTRPQP